jgi:mono/diheme cytochrome c family protein
MKVVKWIGIVLGALLLIGLGTSFYFKAAAQKRLAKTYDVTVEPIPIPYPLSDAEIAELREEKRKAGPAGSTEDPLAGVDLVAIARERGLLRGKHYLESRAACRECHGEDFGGKTIVDNPVMGKWIAPNITLGGVTSDYRPEDWVRIVRHGLLRSGLPAVMPSFDFAAFSDQELSDIALYIQSQPKVSRVMPKSELGPVYSMLIANGQIPVSAEVIDHRAERPKRPPGITVNSELGKHLGATCKGCHGAGLSGGPIQGGDPAWPPAKNLTFDDSGLAKWTLADFRKALHDGVRPDGTAINRVMPISYTSRLAPEEVDALYLYLQSVPKRAYGNH